MSRAASLVKKGFFIMAMIANAHLIAGMHDPTKPIADLLAVKTEQMESTYTLQSVVIGPQRRLALINGQLVGVGSMIQGARVLAIGKNHVLLLYAGQKQIIYLFGKRLWKAH